MANRTVKVSLRAEVDNYIANMQAAGKSTKKLEQTLEQQRAASIAAAKAQGEAWRELGSIGVRMGLVLAAGIAVAVARFAEFDQAMSQVKAATQESAENMDLLRDAAIEAGASTVFTATEAANAIEELGKAGLTTAEIIDGGLAGALVLAAAGGIGVAEAAGYASIAMKQFGLEGKDATHISDLLAAGAGKAVGDVSDLAAALNQAGLVANGAGFSIEETTGVLAAFADAGLLGSDAGTSLKTAIISLQSPTDKAQKLLDKYNLSFYDGQGQMLGFEKIAGQLESQLGGLDDQTRNSALAQIFGNDALRAANVLYTRGADGIKRYVDQTNDSGYAAKVAADRLDNLAGDVEKLGGAFDTALIRTGSGANDVLRDIVQSVTFLVDAAGSLPQPLINAGLAATVLTAAILLTGGAVLNIVPRFAALKVQLAASNLSLGTFALRTVAAGAAIGGATLLIGLFIARQADAAAVTAELSGTLDEATGAFTDYTRESVKKQLAEAGAFDAAKRAGVSQKELVDAVLKGGDAYEDVTKKIQALNSGIGSLLNPAENIQTGNALTKLSDLNNGLKDSQKNYKDQKAAGDGAATSTASAADAYKDAAVEVEGLNSELTGLIDTINKANGLNQDAASANASYQKALADANAEVKAYTAAHGKSAAALNENSVAGSANVAMLAELAASAQNAAKAELEAGGGAEEYIAALTKGNKQIFDTTLGLTGNATKAQEVADKFAKIPTLREAKIVVDSGSAEAALTRTIDKAQRLRRILTFSISGVTSAIEDAVGKIPARARGGVLPGSPSSRDNMLIKAASGEFVTNAAATANPANRAALEYMNSGGNINAYANASAPVYAVSGGGGGGLSITVPVQISTLAADNPDMFARAVAAGVQTGIRNGSIPADWNKG